MADPRHRAICRYAEKSARDPASLCEADLSPLREAGLADEEIVTLAHVIAFFAGVNRVADGLGVDPEPDWT